MHTKLNMLTMNPYIFTGTKAEYQMITVRCLTFAYEPVEISVPWILVSNLIQVLNGPNCNSTTEFQKVNTLYVENNGSQTLAMF